eukprot:maker-scaffold846_size89341-snap-gene-0.15 protein:Tk05679 transcript:maker-scaffold846_size89341-snap-gene-0.15-mRNA-1 annotation:"hypothetical protein BRAFLDRAFT_126511"
MTFKGKQFLLNNRATNGTMMALLLASVLLLSSASASYIPPYIEGEPLTMEVTALDPPDIRELPLYRIDFTVEDAQGETVLGMVHRSFQEFEKLDEKLNKTVLEVGVELVLPSEATATVANLNDYLQIVAAHAEMTATHLVQDFMGINWSGTDITFMNDLEGFLNMLLVQRLPEFMPEPP